MTDSATITHPPRDRADWVDADYDPADHVAAKLDALGHVGIVKVAGSAPSPTKTGLVWLDTSATPGIGGSVAVTTVTADYTALVTDTVILVNATAAAVTITLPAAAGVEGKVYYIKKIDTSGNAVTIDGNGAETIDDATTAVIGSAYDAVMLVTDASEWWIL